MAKTKGKDKKKNKKQRFQYNRRSEDTLKQRADQQGGMYASIVRDGVAKEWRPKLGKNTVRVYPPTWEDAKHYGFDVWLHSNVGPDNETFVDLKRMKDEADAVEDEIARAKKEGRGDEVDDLKAYRRVCCYCQPRAEEDDLYFWQIPWTLDRDVAALARDDDGVQWIDDPDEGFDITFTLKKEGGYNKYTGIKISRNSKPLYDDDDVQQELLERAAKTPIPDALVYYEYAHVQQLLEQGAAAKKDDDDDDDAAPVTRSSARGGKKGGKKKDKDKDKGGKRGKKRRADDDDEDDDDEDEAPATRSGSSRKPPALDEDDDDDDDDDDDSTGSSGGDEDDEDDDADDADGDDEDEDGEDDEEDDDSGEDADDEDLREQVSKPGKRARLEDDDDEDD